MFGFGKEVSYTYQHLQKAIDITNIEALNKAFEEGYTFFHALNQTTVIVNKTIKTENN